MMLDHPLKRRNKMNQNDKKHPEPIILELDDRLEFGAVVVESGDPTALGLDTTQCSCNTGAGCGIS
jgi:hypothetical protein